MHFPDSEKAAVGHFSLIFCLCLWRTNVSPLHLSVSLAQRGLNEASVQCMLGMLMAKMVEGLKSCGWHRSDSFHSKSPTLLSVAK